MTDDDGIRFVDVSDKTPDQSSPGETGYPDDHLDRIPIPIWMDMPTLGVIGYGRMSGMIISGLLESGTIRPEELMITTRRMEKLDNIIRKYPGITTSPNACEVARHSGHLLLGVRPLDLIPLLMEIRSYLSPESHLISIAAGITTDDIGQIFPGQITRILPNIAVSVCSGVILVSHGRLVSEQARDWTEFVFTRLGFFLPADEGVFDTASDLMSCVPAFFSVIIEELASASERTGSFSREDAITLVSAAFSGTGALLASGMKTGDIPSLVATPGGITEQGMVVLKREMPGVWERVLEQTGHRHTHFHEIIEDQIRNVNL